MVFTVWLDEFCILHVKLQTMAKILEENLILDVINNIKKFMIPVRSMDIENFVEISDRKNREWYSNGQIYFEDNYENGKPHGICREWHENGQIWSEYNYEKGILYGMSRVWHENGQIKNECNYKNGVRHGIRRAWYENGQIYYDHNYENGKPHGINRGWNENGQIAYEENYKRYHGIIRESCENG